MRTMTKLTRLRPTEIGRLFTQAVGMVSSKSGACPILNKKVLSHVAQYLKATLKTVRSIRSASQRLTRRLDRRLHAGQMIDRSAFGNIRMANNYILSAYLTRVIGRSHCPNQWLNLGRSSNNPCQRRIDLGKGGSKSNQRNKIYFD